MDTIPEGTVFEAFNISSETWDAGSHWSASSIDKMIIIEGSVKDDHSLTMNAIGDQKSIFVGGLRNSFRHLICRSIDGEKQIEFTHYRASQITNEHKKLNYLLYVHPTGKKWAIAENHTKVVVMFKNDQTDGRWVLYENNSIDLTTDAGHAEWIKVIRSKQGKGYNLDGTCTYNGIIKQ
ncbi:hypothetical protein GCM10009347_38690 [Shewanella algicola]|uniref:Uncharacterized protein n=1 Tax=Shewanella algicola TaxID=640633 RepID=A0A9X1ZF10_9GAMM|nr:hypothetical protein [Shewanella algicola]MCL1107510.1 hypothetical protein [Shewanella algicola]GGP69753.1 hypothetical protein GCM10009347_38690 [Shewanella algicola]